MVLRKRSTLSTKEISAFNKSNIDLKKENKTIPIHIRLTKRKKEISKYISEQLTFVNQYFFSSKVISTASVAQCHGSGTLSENRFRFGTNSLQGMIFIDFSLAMLNSYS